MLDVLCVPETEYQSMLHLHFLRQTVCICVHCTCAVVLRVTLEGNDSMDMICKCL